MKKNQLIVMLLLAALASGCSNLKFQWAASYQTDNLIEDLRRAEAKAEVKEPVK